MPRVIFRKFSAIRRWSRGYKNVDGRSTMQFKSYCGAGYQVYVGKFPRTFRVCRSNFQLEFVSSFPFPTYPPSLNSAKKQECLLLAIELANSSNFYKSFFFEKLMILSSRINDREFDSLKWEKLGLNKIVAVSYK